MIPKSLGTATAYIKTDAAGIAHGCNVAIKKMQGFQKKLKSSGLATIKLGVVMAAPMAMATKVFASFDDQMRETQAVTGATGEAFERMTEQAKFLGRTTSFTARQVASATTELGRAGFAVKEIQAAVPAVLNLARATGTDLTEATTIASSTLRAFGLDAGEMTHICLLYTSPSPRDLSTSRMPSSA